MKSASTFSALRHRNFRLFYTGQMISLTGSWMQSVAFSWLVLVLTNSSFYLGLVGALQTLPVLLFSFLGGVVADHTSKLRLMFLTQAALLLLALALGLLVDLELIKIWDLCIIVFLSGTVMAFDIPARQAFIVDLVGRRDLPNAIALNSTLFNFTRVLGPAVGGVIIAAVGMANCFFLNAASFLAVILALAMMRLPQARRTPWKPFLHAWKELLDYLWTRRELRLILLMMTLVAVTCALFFQIPDWAPSRASLARPDAGLDAGASLGVNPALEPLAASTSTRRCSRRRSATGNRWLRRARRLSARGVRVCRAAALVVAGRAKSSAVPGVLSRGSRGCDLGGSRAGIGRNVCIAAPRQFCLRSVQYSGLRAPDAEPDLGARQQRREPGIRFHPRRGCC